jgi:toxin FitB
VIILDTNVISELMKSAPNTDVVRWVASQPRPSLFTTTVTMAEILYGISILDFGKRQAALETSARAIFTADLQGRVLPFDEAAAVEYAAISRTRRAMGRPISQFDAQIAAIARSRGATVATRNEEDFANCEVDLVNPWRTAS